MRRLSVFDQVSRDGRFAGSDGDIPRGPTMMARYWPTPLAMERTPIVAERMNRMPKVVFSRTLELTGTRAFANGNVLLCYQPASSGSRRRSTSAERLECGENRRTRFGAERRASTQRPWATLRIAVRLGEPRSR